MNLDALWKALPTIETERVRLRTMVDQDIDALFTIFSNPEVMRYWSFTPLVDREAAAGLLAQTRELFEQRTMMKWGVALRENDELIGTATLIHPDLTHHRVEIGYALARAHWGNGYISEALRALLEYAFKELAMHRIEADVDPRNAASIKTLERLGFQREGYLRERWHVGGEIQDALFYGLLRPEWEVSGSAGIPACKS